MFVCVCIGVFYLVVFGGFFVEVLRDCFNDGEVKVVIIFDGGFCKDKLVLFKFVVDVVLVNGVCFLVIGVFVVQCIKQDVEMVFGCDQWWYDLVDVQSVVCFVELMVSEDCLFVFYILGFIGKFKGVVYIIVGYNFWVYFIFQWIFDIWDEDVFWCMVDVGWIIGYSYIVYGFLLNGVMMVMYEGVLCLFKFGVFWELIQKYGIIIFYMVFIVIWVFMKSGCFVLDQFDMSSFCLFGIVGELINLEVWMWYCDVIGGNCCLIVDIWWQIEIGGVMISFLLGVMFIKFGFVILFLFGIQVDIIDVEGNSCGDDEGGYLVVCVFWFGMMCIVYGNF